MDMIRERTMARTGWPFRGMAGGLLIFTFSLAAPQAWAKKKGPVQAIQAQTEIPEESLLDVGIQVLP